MGNKCLICNTEYNNERGLSLHITKTHDISIGTYHQTYFPRFDLFTKELINYKDKEFYFTSLFNNRENYIKYIKSATKEEAQKVTIDLLKIRKETKKLIYLPSTVEGKSSICPTPAALEYLGLNIDEVCKFLGLINRYNYKTKLNYKNPEKLELICDNREQKPLDFINYKVINHSLDFGDITACDEYFNNVFIDRKSAQDMIGSFGTQLERIEKEILRAKELGAYLIFICEKDLQFMLHFDKSEWINKFTKATPEWIFHNIRELLQKYDNLQVLFVNGRQRMVNVAVKIFCLQGDISKIDLQHLYEQGKI